MYVCLFLKCYSCNDHIYSKTGIFLSRFMQPVSGSKNSIFKLSHNTQSHTTPYETLKYQEKSLPLQTNNVQTMLLQSEKLSEMSLPAIWRPKLQKFSFWYQCGSPSWSNLFKQTVKKLLHKSAWIKAWKNNSQRPWASLPSIVQIQIGN